MDHQQGWLGNLLVLQVFKLEDTFVTKYEGPHADHLPIPEAKCDVFPLNLFQRNFGQLEHV